MSRIIPLPHAAAHAITLALRDKSDIVRAEAAAAVRGNRVDASEAISDQQADEDFDIDEPQTTGQSQNLEAFVAGNTAKDTRIYSKAEIIAAIAPDKNHEYPSELKYLVSVVHPGSLNTNAKFLASVHTEQDGVNRLAVWEKLSRDKYERLLV
ncbi:MAG TPA: hypothetical protein VMF50_02350, partial [Candidatus Binataceae bacterium]|nr:hypothetical protein [Candidatus Binataceae bacterium]